MKIEKEDSSSLSNSDKLKTLALSLQLLVDFKSKTLKGHVDLDLVLLKDSPVAVLDTDALVIGDVVLLRNQAEEKLEKSIGERKGVFGEPLTINIPTDLQSAGSKFTVRIYYNTTKESSALQWMEPVQTAGKVHPFLFSTSQFIHARSLMPCMDTNIHKFTYKASISVAAPLTVLMGATFRSKELNAETNVTTFNYTQDVPVPAYLLAIAVGNLESREAGPRTRVWAEPEVVEKGIVDCSKAEKFLKAGEELLGPYVWGRYDILLMPPAYPFGGMENPQLTFATASLLDGEGGMECVISHEISHSWMGNLVTCRYWSEYFLTEGFNVFIDRKLQEKVYSKDLFDFEALGGIEKLKLEVANLGPTSPLTCLRIKEDGIDPDDMFSMVPFEKGSHFLCYLQSLVGVPKFEAWLKAYVNEFKFQSITIDQMKDFFVSYFASETEALSKIDWDKWLDQPGMPDTFAEFSDVLKRNAVALAGRWAQGGKDCGPDDLKDFPIALKIEFLDELLRLNAKKTFTLELVQEIDKAYHFTDTKNADVRLKWHLLCLRTGNKQIIPHVIQFLTEHGRMKYVRTLYKELHQNPETRQLAADTFKRLSPTYHAIGVKQIAKDLSVE